MTPSERGRPAKPDDEKAKTTSLRLPPELLERIKARARAEGLTFTELMIRAATRYLDSR